MGVRNKQDPLRAGYNLGGLDCLLPCLLEALASQRFGLGGVHDELVGQQVIAARPAIEGPLARWLRNVKELDLLLALWRLIQPHVHLVDIIVAEQRACVLVSDWLLAYCVSAA